MNRFMLSGEGRPMRLEYVCDGSFFVTPQEHLCIRVADIKNNKNIVCYDFTFEKSVTHNKSSIVMPCNADINLTSYTKGGNYYE